MRDSLLNALSLCIQQIPLWLQLVPMKDDYHQSNTVTGIRTTQILMRAMMREVGDPGGYEHGELVGGKFNCILC